MIRVFVLDHNFHAREGLKHRLQDAQINVCGESDTVRTAMRDLVRLTCDLIILDYWLLDLLGLEAIRRLRRIKPRAKFMVLLEHYNAEILMRLRRLQVHALLPKAIRYPIPTVVKSIYCGATYCHPTFAKYYYYQQLSKLPLMQHLNDRQYEIVMAYMIGRNYRDIAKAYCLSISTVRNYKSYTERLLRRHHIGLRDYFMLCLH